MTNSVTLDQLKAQALDRADMTNSGFIVDSAGSRRLEEYINAALSEAYDLLTNCYEDYFLSTANITVTNGTDNYSLTSLVADFYKLRKAFWLVGSTRYVMERFELDEITSAKGYPDSEDPVAIIPRYRLVGSKLYVYPDSIGGTIQLWYIPELTRLSSDSTPAVTTISWNLPVGWEEYVVLGAAIRCLIKEESDPGPLMALQQQQRQRIIESASPRDLGGPSRVVDVYSRDYGRLDRR